VIVEWLLKGNPTVIGICSGARGRPRRHHGGLALRLPGASARQRIILQHELESGAAVQPR
jgi:hypothetical protein